MTQIDYQLREPELPRLGLIVLRVDETIEEDFRHQFAPDTARLHVTRVQSGDSLTPDTIADMGRQLTNAASLLPSCQFEVIGYACTSGTAQIGAEAVRDIVKSATQTAHVTNPLSAVIAYLNHNNIRRIGLVSPYTDVVSEPLKAALTDAGITIEASLSFGEEVEARVARIDPVSTAEAARALVKENNVDGIFLSCTNLQTRTILEGLSAELGIPVFGSNSVLAWHMRHLAGLNPAD